MVRAEKNLKKKIYQLIEYGISAKRMYDKTHIAAYSAQAAFFVLVSAVPLTMVFFVVTGALIPGAADALTQAAQQFFTQQAGRWMFRLVQEIRLMATVPFLSLTTAFLVWSATRGIRSIADGISTIYGSEREYNFFQTAVRSVGYAFVLVAVVVLSFSAALTAQPLAEKLAEFTGSDMQIVPVFLSSRSAAVMGALVLLFAFAYKSLARSDIPLKGQLPGAVFAAVGWVVYSAGYSVYIRHFSKYSLLYGSLGAVMLFMLWLYMCMNILLCGALLNRMRAEGKKCD